MFFLKTRLRAINISLGMVFGAAESVGLFTITPNLSIRFDLTTFDPCRPVFSIRCPVEGNAELGWYVLLFHFIELRNEYESD
ncbi:hypothetical protein C5Y96_20205 [Blastopirellula marina]|uniref:Uncharacterized protein n=1 Tax=Blastopirellula marina TaxID=124 RepID=A0A2S8F2J6_9BACT|nr:hypothetical protein C5Y96_20205 [Blastopirellula marina]RCS44819.1 hypothetical protein DTL36_20235 [Bremerella cremea]